MRPSEDEETNLLGVHFGAQRTPRRPTKPNFDSHGFDNHGLMCDLSSFCEIRAKYEPFAFLQNHCQKTQPLIAFSSPRLPHTYRYSPRLTYPIEARSEFPV